MKGFYGKLLRVDLSGMSWRQEEIEDRVFAEYLGGKGLGTYLLLTNVEPGTDPLSPQNKLIFTVGPAAGTNIPGTSRYSVFSKSPQTGGCGESYSGGRVAPAIKAAGCDAVIIEGKSDRPVYLEISDGGVFFREAGHLWGLDTYTAQDKVLGETGVPGAQALVIGPAGENLVRFACLENNYWRSAGRTGMGAVMGSKKVKALVFHGKARCEYADAAQLRSYGRELGKSFKEKPIAKSLRSLGTPAITALLNKMGTFPTRYWSAGTMPGWEKICGEALRENFDVKPRACPGCVIGCGNLTTVRSGHHAGLRLEGPEYETIYAFGGLCCIEDLGEIIYLNDLCDRLGLDTISTGNLVGLAMEATARGLGGVRINYGDAGGAARLIRQIAHREGAGAVLADGIRQACREWSLPDGMAVHVKGLEPPGYDPRVLKGMGLSYATSTRGACHLKALFYKPELVNVISPEVVAGKAGLFVEYENKVTIFDSLILCVFYRDLFSWEDLSRVIALTTGMDLSQGDLSRMANGITTAARLFNIRQGLGKADDGLPERFYREPLDGKTITRGELEYMLAEYYALRGWDSSGCPVQQ